MDPAAQIFFLMLAAQFTFTGLLMWSVARRFPARLRLYRFVAPAPVPIFCFAMAITGFLAWMRQQHLPNWDEASTGIVLRMAVSYVVLWLVGVVWGSLIARWTRRR